MASYDVYVLLLYYVDASFWLTVDSIIDYVINFIIIV